MKKFIKFSIASVLSTLIAACSTTSQLTKSHTQPPKSQTSYTISNSKSNSSESDLYFQNILISQLKNKNIILNEKEADTEIKYDLVFNEGNRALRYLVGFGAGKATGNVKVSLLNKADHTPIASINTNASLSMGVFGGDAKTVLNNAAKDITTKIVEAEIFNSVVN